MNTCYVGWRIKLFEGLSKDTAIRQAGSGPSNERDGKIMIETTEKRLAKKAAAFSVSDARCGFGDRCDSGGWR